MTEIPNWLRRFFQGGNKIDLEKIVHEQYDPKFQSVLAPLVLPACRGYWPILLPMSCNGQLWFYAAAQDGRALFELRRVLRAFLGSADIKPDLLIVKSPGNSAEEAILERAPAGIIKLTLLDQLQTNFEAKERVFKALGKVLEVYEQRPELTSLSPRPSGRILRDFFTAYQTHDGKSAFKFYEELKVSGSLSQRNMLFLELQALAASQQWEAILGHEQLPDLLSSRIPQKLTRILLCSLGHTGMNDFIQDENSFLDELKNVRANCEPLSPLFLTPPNFENHQCFTNDWKLWAVGAASIGFTRFSDYLPSFIDPDWAAKLARWAGLESYEKSDSCSTFLIDTPLAFEDVVRLLQHSLVAKPDELHAIVTALESMATDVRQQLERLPLLNHLWESLWNEQKASQSGWVQWFSELIEPNADIHALGQDALSNFQQWRSDSFDAEHILIFLQSNLTDGVGGVLRNTLPLMLEWLGERQINCSAIFWIEWLELLALDKIVSTQDLSLAGQLSTRILVQPHSHEEYLRILEAIEVLWDKCSSITGYTVVLELMEILLEATCSAKDARKALWLNIQGFALHKWNRLEVSQRHLTRCLASEILSEEALSVFPSQDFDDDSTQILRQKQDLKGKLLAIYSLTEGSARRAKAVLEKMFSGLKVEVNHDHTATSILVNLAKKAEYFVFAASSAKHQAFYPVNKIRNDLIYPQGKGASSIISAFLEAAL